ncbi:MAG TPA: hypothetical protein DEH24_15770 [Alteromonas sp.]|nr:hypothetical protein [Alteromonas sp.]
MNYTSVVHSKLSSMKAHLFVSNPQAPLLHSEIVVVAHCFSMYKQFLFANHAHIIIFDLL